MGDDVVAQHGNKSEGSAGAVICQHGIHSTPAESQGRRMTLASASDLAAAAGNTREERRAFGVAAGAHALHDGYTDLIYVMLPIWQAEFGLGYAALGLLRGLFTGTMAGFQIPSGFLAERFG